MTTFQPGDRVRHDPTGDEWVLIRVYGSYVVWLSWPVSRALAADCTLIARNDASPCTCATEDQRRDCAIECDAVLL